MTGFLQLLALRDIPQIRVGLNWCGFIFSSVSGNIAYFGICFHNNLLLASLLQFPRPQFPAKLEGALLISALQLPIPVPSFKYSDHFLASSR